MTRLGKYLLKHSVNKAEVARKTGLSGSRLSELSINAKTKLRTDELYKIALAIGTDPCELLEYVCEDISLGE